jgi:hypothetical protein
MSAQDEAFLAAFEAATIPGSEFRHRQHVRVAWLYVREYGTEEALRLMAVGIRRFAVANGATALYHETITRAWVLLVAAAVRRHPAIDGFDAFVEANPGLLDKETPYAFYRRETLASDAARSAWVEPDRLPLP